MNDLRTKVRYSQDREAHRNRNENENREMRSIPQRASDNPLVDLVFSFWKRGSLTKLKTKGGKLYGNVKRNQKTSGRRLLQKTRQNSTRGIQGAFPW